MFDRKPAAPLFAALLLAGLGATARPAKADADDILRFLAGAIVVGATAWARIASLAGPDEHATTTQAFSSGRAANDG